jgi:hypothetical protein
MNNQLHLNRRQFLRATGPSGMALPPASAFAPEMLSAQSLAKTIGVRCIGVGTRRGSTARSVKEDHGCR